MKLNLFLIFLILISGVGASLTYNEEITPSPVSTELLPPPTYSVEREFGVDIEYKLVELPSNMERLPLHLLGKDGMIVEGKTEGMYLVSIPQAQKEGLIRSGFVFRDIPVERKISEQFLRFVNEKPNEEVKVFVSVFRDVKLENALNQFSVYSNFIRSPTVNDNVFLIKTTRKNLMSIAELDITQRIEEYGPPVQTNAYRGMPAIGGDIMYSIGAFTGNGITIEFTDSGFANSSGETHPDLPDPLDEKNYCELLVSDNATDVDGHGTYVTGIAIGRGVNESKYRGVAPNASFLAYRFTDCNPWPSHFGDVLTDAANNNASISSNSWLKTDTSYTDESKRADKAVLGDYTNSTGDPVYMTVVFSAGNHNSSIRAPANCKNCITVGAAKTGNHPLASYNYSFDGFWCVDSNGPAGNITCYTDYGPFNSRTKPDVIAPGNFIESTCAWYLGICGIDGNEYYTAPSSGGGTSASAPYVSGLAALMMEAHSSLKSWPEQLKAKIINSAIILDDVDSGKQGLGHVNAFNALYDQYNIFNTSLWNGNYTGGVGNVQNYTFNVSNGYKEVKVTLVYSDDAVTGGATVQDLNLKVYDGSDSLVGESNSSNDPVEQVVATSGSNGTPPL